MRPQYLPSFFISPPSFLPPPLSVPPSLFNKLQQPFPVLRRVVWQLSHAAADGWSRGAQHAACDVVLTKLHVSLILRSCM